MKQSMKTWSAPTVNVVRMDSAKALFMGVPSDGQFAIQNGQTVALLHS